MHSATPYWMAASLSGIAPHIILQALDNFPGIEALMTASYSDLIAQGFNTRQATVLTNTNWQRVEFELAWAEQPQHTLVTYIDPNYPALLRETSDPPLLLYVRGNVSLLTQPQIAMVGSRRASPFGLQHADRFARALVASGYAVTSGLAKGIDAAAHQGALTAQGKTIAVMGTGQHHIYPRTNRALADRIVAAAGAIISEFPVDTKPLAAYFPQRNRIIAGMSLGVLVVEAALKSGSLITARLAAEAGRDVFAIPGSIQHIQARGCHALIKQGAKLIESIDDIVSELGALNAVLDATGQEVPRKELLPEHLHLLEQIEYAVTPLDEIILRSGLTAAAVSAMLLSMELSGWIASMPGGYMRTKPY